MGKLTKEQRKYLESLEMGPRWVPDEYPPKFHFLWLGNLVDVVGSSVYITEAGRAALNEQEGRG